MSTTRHGAARARGVCEERVLDPPPSTPRHPRIPSAPSRVGSNLARPPPSHASQPARRWRSRAGWCIFVAQRAHTSSRL